MRQVKLQFVNSVHLDTLLNDQQFRADIQHLNHVRLNDNNVGLFDPIQQHFALDSEMVVLSIFSRAIKRLIFPNSNTEIEFLNPFVGQQKGGLVHGNTVIIDSTDVQRN